MIAACVHKIKQFMEHNLVYMNSCNVCSVAKYSGVWFESWQKHFPTDTLNCCISLTVIGAMMT